MNDTAYTGLRDPINAPINQKDPRIFDCPFCGAPKRVNRQARRFWVNMMVRLGMREGITQSKSNLLRKKRSKKP